jgi:Ran GTPase-activating protein (RanGAP) involved in mRNA processing and transport
MSFFQSFEQYVQSVADGKISEIALSHRGLDDLACAALADAISKTDKARVIDLQSNHISSAGVANLCAALRSNSSVVEVNLEHNEIDDAGAASFLQLMETNCSIVSLHLASNKISAPLLEDLSFTVSLNTQPQQLKHLVPRLRAQDPEVTLVDLTGLTGVSFPLLRNVLSSNTQVHTLICAGMGVGDVGCSSFAEIAKQNSSINVLDLSNNAITLHGVKSLISGLVENNSIQRLIMRGNKLGDEAARAIVELLRHNDALSEFEAADNAISGNALDAVHHALDLNRQPLPLKRAYYAAQANDARVTIIDFAWVKGMHNCAKFLAPVLRTNTEVIEINFSNARFGDMGAEALAVVLKTNRSIRKLHAANNEITSTGASSIAVALATNDALTELNLANNLICEIAAGEFTQTLLVNNAITFLNLELNQIPANLMDEVNGLVTVNSQPRGLKAILPALESNAESITLVDFSQFDGERYHTDEAARVLCQALYTNSHVTAVDLSFNSIGDAGASHFAKLLEVNTSIESLNLSQCAISDKGAELIVSALYGNTTLTELDLNSNLISEATGQAFLEMLKHNHFLSTLNVERTRIGDVMANDLTIACAVNTQPQALKKVIPRLREGDTTLVELDLSVYDGHRYFNDAAVAILCHELAENTTLRSLNLSQNQFGAEGAAALGRLLSQANCGITELDVSGNKIGPEGAKHLADAFERNGSLRVVDMRGTGLGNAGVLTVATSLEVNDSIQMIHVTRSGDVSSKSMGELTRQLAINTQSLTLKAVLPLVLNNDPTMSTIAMIGDGEGSVFGDLSANLLALALAKNHTVTTIDLRNNDITSEGAEYFADMLEDNKSITEFNLSSNRIDDEGARAFIRIMSANDTLRVLDLSGNPISEPVMCELDYVMRVNAAPVALKRMMVAIATDDASVTVADFTGGSSNAVFTDDSLHILCSLLVSNTHVHTVLLGNNDITDEGAQLLADMLRVNKTIARLTLDNNQITTEGAHALFLCLKVNHTLANLTLTGNKIAADMLEQLEATLIINKQPLREPVRPKEAFALRPAVEQLDDRTQFRDHDYMRDCDSQIFQDAMHDYHSPPKTRYTRE